MKSVGTNERDFLFSFLFELNFSFSSLATKFNTLVVIASKISCSTNVSFLIKRLRSVPFRDCWSVCKYVGRGEIIGKLIAITFCICIIRLLFQSDLAFVLLDFLLYLLLFASVPVYSGNNYQI